MLHGKAGTVSSKPVQTIGPVTYMTMRHEDVYMLCITKSNVNVMMAFQFMRSVSESAELQARVLFRLSLRVFAAHLLMADVQHESHESELMLFFLILQMVGLCQTYFGGKLNENSVRSNFVLL